MVARRRSAGDAPARGRAGRRLLRRPVAVRWRGPRVVPVDPGAGRMSGVRVVLADDHPVVRAGLAALLGSLPDVEVVGVAADGRSAVKEVVLHRPDVAVLDLQMPGLDGFGATRE